MRGTRKHFKSLRVGFHYGYPIHTSFFIANFLGSIICAFVGSWFGTMARLSYYHKLHESEAIDEETHEIHEDEMNTIFIVSTACTILMMMIAVWLLKLGRCE